MRHGRVGHLPQHSAIKARALVPGWSRGGNLHACVDHRPDHSAVLHARVDPHATQCKAWPIRRTRNGRGGTTWSIFLRVKGTGSHVCALSPPLLVLHLTARARVIVTVSSSYACATSFYAREGPVPPCDPSGHPGYGAYATGVDFCP